MNRDFLETLLMDRALNELPPETVKLLDAYLADHPEMQPRDDSIQETVAIGERAVHVELPTELPAFPKERMLSRRRFAGLNTANLWISVAASLLIGIGIGMSGMRWKNEPPQKHPGLMVSQVQSQPKSDGFASAQAFWSSKTYIDRYQKIRKDRTQRDGNTKLQKQIEEFKKRELL